METGSAAYCPNCGERVNPSDRFCFNCGSDLGDVYSQRDPLDVPGLAAEQEKEPVSRVQAGWYPNPERPGQRYWDGEQWTEHFAPPQQRAQGRFRDPGNDGLATWGYVMAFLFPIVGVVIAVILLGRNDPRGTNVMVLSIVVFFVALFLLSAIDTSQRSGNRAQLGELAHAVVLPR